MIRTAGVGTTLVGPTGRATRLVLDAEAAPLAALDGELVDLTGSKTVSVLRVTDWAVPEGPHGMTAWVGRLEAQGSQLGIADRNSDAYYLLDSASTRLMWEARGRVALFEGYVVGPNEVHMTWWRVISEE